MTFLTHRGQSGTFGARITTSAAQSKAVACIILAGDDFPASVLSQLLDWDIELEVRRLPGKKSTRGLLQYEDLQFGRMSLFVYPTWKLADTDEQTNQAKLSDISRRPCSPRRMIFEGRSC